MSDLQAICQLLECGYTFNEASVLCENKRNKVVFNEVKQKLLQGYMIEQLFCTYCKGSIQQYCSSFLSYLSFSDSLRLTIDLVTIENDNKQQQLKQLGYPLGLLFCSVTGLFLFNRFCLPMLMTLMGTFAKNKSFFMMISSIIDYFITIFYVVTLSVLISIYHLFSKKNIVKTIKVIQTLPFNQLFKQWNSYEFAIFFRECLKMGCKTKESLVMLQALHHPMLVETAKQIELSLLKGENFDSALQRSMIDETLLHFTKIASVSSSMEKMLDGYIQFHRLRHQKRLKKITIIIQCCTYALISCVILIVYQLLLTPLSILVEL